MDLVSEHYPVFLNGGLSNRLSNVPWVVECSGVMYKWVVECSMVVYKLVVECFSVMYKCVVECSAVVFKWVVGCSRVVYKRAALGKTVQVDHTSVLSYCRGKSFPEKSRTRAIKTGHRCIWY